MIVADLVDVAASRPGKPLFSGLSLTVATGDRLGVVGINGCGKSTLLRVLSGADRPESGTVRFGRDVRISVLDQHPELHGDTVRAAAGDDWESEAVLDRLGMGPFLDRPLDQLSGGQVKRVALARALVEPSDLLILDEPTNHLDIDAIGWLEDRLAEYRGALVMVTHDRHVLDRVTTKVLELDRGDAFVHDGGYDAYLDGRAARAAADEQAEAVRRNLARKELAWLRRGAPARTSKPKARIASATAIVEGSARAPAREGELPLHFGTPRLGDQVIELDGVGHRWGDDDWLFRDVTMLLDPRERVGLVGANGTGKSTMLEIMSGRLAPIEGSVRHGSTVAIGYYDQVGRTLDEDARVREVVAGPHRVPDHNDTALMEAFWFDSDVQYAPVRLLSGGERRRLQLLMVLARKPNVLFLDEPTNDLDLDTLRALEDFLDEWPGALVVVSHDRAFLERTVADVVVLDGHGTAARRPGGYAAYERERSATQNRRGSIARSSAGSDASASRSPAASSASASPVSSGPKLRSPSTLRHRLRAVEARQAELSTARERVVAELAAAGGDHHRMAELASELEAAEIELAAVDEEWMELATEVEDRGLRLD